MLIKDIDKMTNEEKWDRLRSGDEVVLYKYIDRLIKIHKIDHSTNWFCIEEDDYSHWHYEIDWEKTDELNKPKEEIVMFSENSDCDYWREEEKAKEEFTNKMELMWEWYVYNIVGKTEELNLKEERMTGLEKMKEGFAKHCKGMRNCSKCILYDYNGKDVCVILADLLNERSVKNSEKKLYSEKG